ncbi:hypothetical protein GIB67_013685 [Kingdonia uniflora]|uniref:Ribosomal RNA methyltransferase FtsJ domain-containing protein n=1 Tax=Kingdonia uniflora TaxID=39325 RepID=A0A7J7NPY6_9MAGN|nr:hypothetical protein GIB67_013685 [Kingdonia uniflora]
MVEKDSKPKRARDDLFNSEVVFEKLTTALPAKDMEFRLMLRKCDELNERVAQLKTDLAQATSRARNAEAGECSRKNKGNERLRECQSKLDAAIAREQELERVIRSKEIMIKKKDDLLKKSLAGEDLNRELKELRAQASHSEMLMAIIAYFVKEIRRLKLERSTWHDYVLSKECICRAEVDRGNCMNFMETKLGSRPAESVEQDRVTMAVRAREFMADHPLIVGEVWLTSQQHNQNFSSCCISIVVLDSKDNIHDATDIDSLDEDYYSEESAAACDEEHNSGDDFDFEDDIVEISSKQQEEQVSFAPSNPLVGSMAPVFTKKGENEVRTSHGGRPKEDDSRSSTVSEDDRRIRKVDETSAVWPAAIVTTMFPEVTLSNNEIELGKASMDLQASCVINEDFTEISHLPMSGRSFSVWRDYQAGFKCTDFIKDRKVSQTRKCTSLEYKVNIMGRASRDKSDIYYRRAKEEGLRARSAFKLLQIDEEFSIFEDIRDDDLSLIVSIDLQPMAPIKGVIQVQGDITNTRTTEMVIKHFNGCKADLVVCNGALDVTGLHDMDEFIHGWLEGPTEGFNPKDLHHLLEKVGTPSGADDLDCSSGWLEGPNKVYIPFMACEDLSGYDSGRSYPLPTVAEGCSY